MQPNYAPAELGSLVLSIPGRQLNKLVDVVVVDADEHISKQFAPMA